MTASKKDKKKLKKKQKKEDGKGDSNNMKTESDSQGPNKSKAAPSELNEMLFRP
ncbi:MAG: hypothetical protein ACMG6E_06930 [Candidatus Roizmanbacteria bacterium]